MCELETDIAKANNGAQGSARQFKEEYIMVVQHNLTAMNSNRMLGLTQSAQAKSTEKLSSGYKINRAADDAAGLSISEKMRQQKQIWSGILTRETRRSNCCRERRVS